jgi:zinc protease
MTGALALLAAWAAAAPAFEQFSLRNGMKVIIAPDHSAPVAVVATIFNIGSRQEQRGRSGFAHLFEHMMFEGSEHAPKGTFDRLLERFGGDNNASTHDDFTLYWEAVPANAVPVALWLDADRLSALKVDGDAIKNQIEVVKEEKRVSVDNEPYGKLLYLEISSHTFVNWQNAHATIGSFEDLDAATLADVRSFFDANYAPSNAIMAIVGDVDPEQARAWVERYFGWIENRAKPVSVDVTEPAPTGRKRVAVSDPHANLPALAITWKGLPDRGTPDHYALAVLGRALFKGKTARLYQDLVKNTEAAVSVDGGLGFPSDSDEYRVPAPFGAFVIYKDDQAPRRIEDRIYAQIREIAARGLSERELTRLKTKLKSDWILDQQHTVRRAERILYAALLDGDPSKAWSIEPFLAVTSADLKRVAARYLTPDASTVFELKAGEGK